MAQALPPALKLGFRPPWRSLGVEARAGAIGQLRRGFIAGLIVFCGSLYLLSLTGQRWLGAVTPLGGLAFLVGWASLAGWALTSARPA